MSKTRINHRKFTEDLLSKFWRVILVKLKFRSPKNKPIPHIVATHITVIDKRHLIKTLWGLNTYAGSDVVLSSKTNSNNTRVLLTLWIELYV